MVVVSGAHCVSPKMAATLVLASDASSDHIAQSRALRAPPADARASSDREWEEQVELQIAPHPELSVGQRKAIELDYGMERGVTTIPVRRALLYYALKRLGLDTDPAARRPQDQQIVLLNAAEIRSGRHGDGVSQPQGPQYA